MRNTILAFFILLSSSIFSQKLLKGVVRDVENEAVFAANVYLKNNQEIGRTTNFNGKFELRLTKENINDTLVISFIGYNIKEIPLSSISYEKTIVIILKKNSLALQEVIIKAREPISEQFSVTKLEMLDIYLNPVSNGDPLKAITSLPASTNMDETANPSLRGSSGDRTRVIFNGIPIYRPVRNSQINGIGHFSLFNTAIIDKQYIYASNPPLTYGNTSAGLIEIETIKKLNFNQLSLSAGLAHAGVFVSQKIRKKSFLQVYGNYQNSEAFLSINGKSLPQLKSFGSKDVGINLHSDFGKQTTFNFYSYGIVEDYRVNVTAFTFKGDAYGDKIRNFNIINFSHIFKNGRIAFNNGTNFSRSAFKYGNMSSKNERHQVYSSIDYKWYGINKLNIQFGLNHDYGKSIFRDSTPVFYYALSPESPNYYSDTTIITHNIEAYYYFSWEIAKKLLLSNGVRTNILVYKQKSYLSYQFSLKYKISRKQSLLLSGGKYHNYSIPNYYSKTYNLLNSKQLALDYAYADKKTLITAAVFYKDEAGERINNEFFQINHSYTAGVELYFESFFMKYFKFSLANTYLNQKIEIEGEKYNGEKNLKYFIKSSLSYNNPNLFNIAVTYITRPGKYYTPVVNSSYNELVDFYGPFYNNDINSRQYEGYNNMSISLSRYFQFMKKSMIVFVSINNILNSKNQSDVFYNFDYSKHFYDHYQQRTIYFGAVWQMNY
ncbi:MAG: TonB-dependent receptor [Bacteroidetes bacterium]|nr:MAG: TonB-dependent receptor [Bacteroidota bacterium]